MVKRDIINGHNCSLGNIVGGGFELVSPPENLHANKTIEHHDNENDKPSEKKK
jgi:hypothetical protein